MATGLKSVAAGVGLSLLVGLSATLPLAAYSPPPPPTRQALSTFRERKVFTGKISSDVARGEQAMLVGKYQDAADAFWKAINKNSKDVSALCGLGFTLALQFKLDGADEQFNKAIKVDPKNPLAHVGRAFVKLNRLQSSNMTIIKQRASILSSAESECRQALKADADMPEALVVLGTVQNEQGKLDDAVSSFTKAITVDPKFGNAYTQRGVVLMKQNNPASAEQDFKQAISIRSGNSTAHFGLGQVYLAQGKVDDALKELNTALALNRNSAPTHIALGDAYSAQGNTVAAVREYQEAVRIKAENEQAYLRLADIREARGDLEVALSELRQGVTLNPNSASLHERIADIALRLEKTDDAIKEYNATLAISPGDVSAVKGMTRAYVIKAQKEAQGAFFLSNNFESAEAMIQQAIKMNPNDMELRLADAKFRAMSGRPVDLSTVGTPTSDPERIAYAEALTAQFKFADAAQQMNTVIGNAADAKSAFAIADIALMDRDLDSAQAAYKKAGSFSDTDAAARSQRGLAAVQTSRDAAQQQLTFAQDLASKKQLGSAVDKFRAAAYQNPRLADAHMGLAQALEKLFGKEPVSLRESALHYRAFISLRPDLPQKEKEKIEKRADKLVEKAYKIEQQKKKV